MSVSFTFNTSPTTDRDELRIAIGDTTFDDGPAPNRANLSDELLDHWLDVGGSINGAAAMAFDHLAALWVSRPVFGPGELSTIHANLYPYYTRLADLYRARSADPDVSGTVVSVTSFTKSDGYSGNGSEYT